MLVNKILKDTKIFWENHCSETSKKIPVELFIDKRSQCDATQSIITCVSLLAPENMEVLDHPETTSGNEWTRQLLHFTLVYFCI